MYTLFFTSMTRYNHLIQQGHTKTQRKSAHICHLAPKITVFKRCLWAQKTFLERTSKRNRHFSSRSIDWNRFLDFFGQLQNHRFFSILNEYTLMKNLELQTIAILEPKTTTFTKVQLISKYPSKSILSPETITFSIGYAKTRLLAEKLKFSFLGFSPREMQVSASNYFYQNKLVFLYR